MDSLAYHVARGHLIHDVRHGAVQLDPHVLAEHIETCASVPREVAAEWAARFLADLQRHGHPDERARRQRKRTARSRR